MLSSHRLALLACLALGAVSHSGLTARLYAQPPAAPGTQAHPGERLIRLNAGDAELTLVELQSRVLETEARIKLVDDFNQSVVSVVALSPNQIRVRGEAPGITTVRIADEFDRVYRVEVMVERDLRELEANLRRLFPGSSIKVVGVRDSIVLRGWVTQPSQIPRIVELARTYSPNIQNHIEIGGGSQVVLSCKVMEVQRSKLEQLGFNFLSLGQHYYLSSNPGALVPIAEATLPFAGPPTVVSQATSLANPTVQFAILGSSDIFRGFIEALKQESLLKILAEPTVTTTSGRPAQLHSGGEFPILVPQGVGTATISFRDFGIRLETVPIVLGNGRVQLDIAAEVSERDFSNSVDVTGVRVPGISNRLVNTRVEMNFGETFMVGGLTQDRVTTSTNKVPVLGDVPVLGAAFSRKTHQLATTELIILVTPHLASPMSEGQVPCGGPGTNSDMPTAKEFLIDGHVEVPRFSAGMNHCPPGGNCPPGLIGPGEYAVSGYGQEGMQYPAYSPEHGPTLSSPHLSSPPMNYAPESLIQPQPQGQPLQAPPSAYDPQQPLPAEPPGTAMRSWPATGLTTGTPAEYRSSSRIRTVAAEPGDITMPSPAPAHYTAPNDPGLIQPHHRVPAAATPQGTVPQFGTRPAAGQYPSRTAPQFMGSNTYAR